MGNDIKLFHPLCSQSLYLLQYLCFRTRDVPTGDERNGAIGALAFATFGNLHIGVVLKSAVGVSEGDLVKVRFADGTLECRVLNKN